MSTTGQKAHRRTTSLSAGFNSSSDDLLTPVQRAENSRQQQPYLSPLNTQPPSKNAQLSVIAEKNATPPTPSKTKADPALYLKRIGKIRPNGILTYAGIKNYTFTAMFFFALYIFLSSLCGIGDVPDYVQLPRARQKPASTPTPSLVEPEFVAAPSTTPNPHDELRNEVEDEVNEHDQNQDQVQDQGQELNDDPFGVADAVKSDGADNANRDAAGNAENAEQPADTREREDTAHDLDNALQLDTGAHLDNGEHLDHAEQLIDSPPADGQQPDAVNDEGILANPFDGLSSSINNANEAAAHVVMDDNFGHTDELLANNGNPPLADGAADARLADTDFGDELPDLLPNMLTKQDRVNPDAEGGQIDYSTYAYKNPPPHFTYTEFLSSLSEDDRTWVRQTRKRQMITDESRDAACGNWRQRYTEMQQNIMDGSSDQRYVAYVCDSSTNCGGLADRIFGMTSAFLFGLFTNRAFLADWQVPLPLDAIFESPNIDWNYDSRNSHLHTLDSYTLDIVNFSSQHLDRTLFHANWTLKYQEPFIKFHSNRGIVIGAYKSKIYQPVLKEMGLRQQYAFGCILDYLFRPKPTSMAFITQYTSLFALPNVFSVGIQIHTGNKHDADPRTEQSVMSQYHDFFRCADQLVSTYATSEQKVAYFLVTDSEKLRNEAMSMENVIVTGLPMNLGHHTQGHADLVHNSVIENWILSKTNFRVISPGGYGKLSAFHSKVLHSTITIYPPSEQDARDFYHRTAPDCTREDAFTTFLEFASEGSLG